MIYPFDIYIQYMLMLSVFPSSILDHRSLDSLTSDTLSFDLQMINNLDKG
jgi:hypothetical protein